MIPKECKRLAEELRKAGGEIKRQTEREFAEMYPKDRVGTTSIAYLRARTMH